MTNWTKKRSIMKRYDLTAQMYDTRYEAEQKAKINAALNAIKKTRLGLLLDAGCGTGILFEHISDFADTILGVDFSSQTLRQAKKRLGEQKHARIYLVQADVDNMPFRHHVFDNVFAITVLQNVPDAKRAVKEMIRVGKDTATYVLTGLKRIFSQDNFETILSEANLKAETLENDELKCHVAICKEMHKHQ